MAHKSRPHRRSLVEKSLIVAQIDIDHIYTPYHPDAHPLFDSSRVGTRWTISALDVIAYFPQSIAVGLTKTRFRVCDDDMVPYYGGWLYNDQDCRVQEMVLRWAQSDAGATVIEVKDLDKWKQEIG